MSLRLLSLDSDFHPDPELVERVERWLERRDEFTPLLTAFCEELSGGGLRHALRRLVEKINAGVGAAELCRSRAMVSTLLPLLACDAGQQHAAQRLNTALSESLREDEHRRRRWRVLAYPLGLIALAMGVVVFLSLTVTPVFRSIFNDFQLELPGLTTKVLMLSSLLVTRPLELAGSVIGSLALVCFGWRLLIANGPLLVGKGLASVARGNSRSVAVMAQFTRRLAEGLAASLPLPVALRVAGETNPSLFLRRIARRIANESVGVDGGATRKGAARLASLRSSRWLPATLLHLLDLDDPGDPDATPRRLHDYAYLLAERVESRFEWATGIVAQAAVALVGAGVALILLALLLPLVKLVEGLT